MNSVLFAIVVFVLFAGAALLALALHSRLPERHRTKETQDAIKIGVGLVVVLSALVISLLTSSVKSSFDTATRDLKRFSTQIILLDRTLRAYGAEAKPTRRALEAYAARALAGTWPKDGGAVVVEDRRAEDLLEQVRDQILSFAPASERLRVLAGEAKDGIRKLIEQRWTLVEDSASSLNLPFLGILVFWLTLVFASFGYNVPRNALVVASLVLCALSITGALFLIVEMDGPLDGLIKVSGAPLEEALAHTRE